MFLIIQKIISSCQVVFYIQNDKQNACSVKKSSQFKNLNC